MVRILRCLLLMMMLGLAGCGANQERPRPFGEATPPADTCAAKVFCLAPEEDDEAGFMLSLDQIFSLRFIGADEAHQNLN